ncbi:ArsA-related P-loop ATPase [Streptomyces sp. DSM 44917]|uniref:ArsA-related P-loop ATPase n=1 Tax=Streptomyces boetiae TaxID=3075541 RepID=A0ABU2LE89_9ACTN|nr:ArsA-related P-loop ATPase [Streptomyces sp. DSM 44917]MDT0309822.1 ArsA-related P-loop ATPase [Streptomyces sp. DSM 44917]
MAPPPAARVLFVTGPGGAGTSTVAAATASSAARAGERPVLLLAPPRAAAPPFPATSPLEPGLHHSRVDPAGRFRAGALAAQRLAAPALDALGAVPFDGEELTELPGAHAAALLSALRAAAAGPWGLVVADLPPVTEAVRLLALPAQLRRYLRRLLPAERLAARALRPLLGRLAGVPLPDEGLFAAADRLDAALAGLQELIEGPAAAVRLVLDPAPGPAAEARAARAGLALHGVALESVVANRLLPATSPDPWLAALAERQREALAAFAEAAGLAGEAVHRVPHLGREPAHPAEPDVPPPGTWPAPRPAPPPEPGEAGLLVWRLPLPGAVREDLELIRRGGELLVRVGPFRRMLPLPAALRRCAVAGAAFEPGEDGAHRARLAVRFAPDPARWP